MGDMISVEENLTYADATSIARARPGLTVRRVSGTDLFSVLVTSQSALYPEIKRCQDEARDQAELDRRRQEKDLHAQELLRQKKWERQRLERERMSVELSQQLREMSDGDLSHYITNAKDDLALSIARSEWRSRFPTIIPKFSDIYSTTDGQ